MKAALLVAAEQELVALEQEPGQELAPGQVVLGPALVQEQVLEVPVLVLEVEQGQVVPDRTAADLLQLQDNDRQAAGI